MVNGSIEFVIFLLLGLITICTLVPMSDDEMDLIVAKFNDWSGSAPRIDVITEGVVTDEKEWRYFRFKFLAEDGQHCTGKVSLSTNGTGKHSWDCDGEPWSGEEDDEDERTGETNSRRRRGKKKGAKKWKKKTKTYKRKGLASNIVKKGKKKRKT